MSYSFQQLAALLEQAGLDSASAAVGAAVALAESGGDPGAVGDAGTSFGLWQIHLSAHPEVTQPCALDPHCAAAAVVRISNGGADWTPWTAFRSGAYRAFQAADVAWKITLRFGETGPFGGTEVGTDVGVPQGTAVLTPWAGTVTLVEDKGKLDWGKRVLIHIDEGPLQGLTYGAGHLTQASVVQGQKLRAGTVVGLSGGDPSDPSSGGSTGQHVEFQFLDAAGRWLDPEQIVAGQGMDFGGLFGGGAGGPAAHAMSFNPLDGVGQAIGDAVQSFVFLLIGLVLLSLGLMLVVLGSLPWGRIGQAAAGATPQGRAVGAAAGAGA